MTAAKGAEPESGARLHRLPRQQATLDALDLFAKLDDGEGRIDRRRVETVMGRYHTSMEDSLASPSRLHGWRAQAMFEAIVAALGTVRLLKTEDAGDCWFRGEGDRDLKVPDFRVVTEGRKRWLVEVKNYFQKSPTDDFQLAARELERLSSFAALEAAHEVVVAVYWARWQLWTLVDADTFRLSGSRAVLPMSVAFKGNRMSELGDHNIGVRAPLTLDLLSDSPQPVDEDGEARFTVSKVELRCAGRLLRRADEKRLAMNLLMYGGWGGEDEALLEANHLIGLRWTAAPEGEPLTPTQGFDIVGTLSSLYSRMFDAATLGASGVERLRIDVEAGSLSALIPTDYESPDMPVWRLIQVQNADDTV